MCYPYDYWRFTPEAFRSLLKPFKGVYVGSQGSRSFPHTVVGVGFKGDTTYSADFAYKCERWQKSDIKSIRQLILKLTPPVALPVISLLYRTLKAKDK
jgi:hypothetical protein